MQPKFTYVIVIFYLITWDVLSYAEDLRLIRDSEVEDAVHQLVRPIFKASGLDDSEYKIIIIDSPAINAFVAKNVIAIHSRLLTEFYDDPDVLLGVIAHEIGHIKANHLVYFGSKASQLSKASILTFALLGVASMATSSPEILMTSILGASQIAERELLRYSREQESVADQIAVKLLTKSHNTVAGLGKIMEYFAKYEQAATQLNPYAMTHPLSQQRLDFVNNYFASSKYKKSGVPKEVRSRYVRAMMKLKIFTQPSFMLSAVVDPLKYSNDYLYARAVMSYYHEHNYEEALRFLERALSTEKDSYFYQFKANILFEIGMPEESIKFYDLVNKERKSDALLAYEYAIALLDLLDKKGKDVQLIDKAIGLLNMVISTEPENISAYNKLAAAYGLKGDIRASNLFLAEEALLLKKYGICNKFAKNVLDTSARKDSLYMKASDLLLYCGDKNIKHYQED